jgi:hypothetical protein
MLVLMTIDIETPDGMAWAVAWQNQMVRKIKDGGTWLIPSSQTIITVNITAKKATFLAKGIAAQADRVKQVFLAMGWMVVERD